MSCRRLKGRSAASASGVAGSDHAPAVLARSPWAIHDSTRSTTNSGLPSVRSWSRAGAARSGRRGVAEPRPQVFVRPRPRRGRPGPAPSPCLCLGRAPKRWRAAGGRPASPRRVGRSRSPSGARARAAGRARRADRSSRRRSTADPRSPGAAASRPRSPPRASAISRSMRSRVALRLRRSSASSAAGSRSPGIWASQVGACRSRSRHTAVAGRGDPAQPVERLEDRQVGLARPPMLQALAAPDPDRGVGERDVADEGLDQGGLADPGLAGDEDDLTGRVERLREALAQVP